MNRQHLAPFISLFVLVIALKKMMTVSMFLIQIKATVVLM